MVLLSVIAGILTIVLLKYCYDFYLFWRFFQKLPGETSFHLLLGNMHKLPGPNEEGLQYEMEQMEKFKYLRRVWAGPFVPVILCYHPSVVKTILKSSAPKPHGTIISTPYDMGLRWIGDGLLLSNGAKWSRNRRLLTPAFHFDILKDYINVYNKCTRLYIDKLDSLQGESFDVFDPVTLCTLDVILRTAFSYESNCQTIKEQNTYVKSLTELVYLWTIRSYNPFHFIEFIYGLTSKGRQFYKLCDIVHEIGEEIIEKRRTALEDELHDGSKGNPKVRDFLDTLILARDENGNGLSKRDIRDEVDTFLFEGHDTTTSGVSWALYSLASHPKCQEKVHQEVLQVLGDREELEWEDMAKLEYTTMCIKESMRLHGVVPFIERKLNEPLELHDHVIPEGTLVAVQIWDLHHNPLVWDKPHEYIPERFSAENLKTMDPFQFLPFSAGSRNCIGQNFAMNEMRVIVSSTIKSFRLEIDEKEKPRKFFAVTMKTEKGAKIYASRRD